MERIRIAIGSNDGKKIAPGHMGDAEYFYVYDVHAEGEAEFVERRDNTTPGDEKGHGRGEKRRAVLEILNDVDLLVGRRVSPNFKKIAKETEVQPVVSQLEDIEEILNAISESFERFRTLVRSRRDGERPEEIPVLEG